MDADDRGTGQDRRTDTENEDIYCCVTAGKGQDMYKNYREQLEAELLKAHSGWSGTRSPFP